MGRNNQKFFIISFFLIFLLISFLEVPMNYYIDHSEKIKFLYSVVFSLLLTYIYYISFNKYLICWRLLLFLQSVLTVIYIVNKNTYRFFTECINYYGYVYWCILLVMYLIFLGTCWLYKRIKSIKISFQTRKITITITNCKTCKEKNILFF